MLAVIDYRSSKETITNLGSYAEDIYLFRTEGITYNSISGHPDIFIYQDKNNLITAPNIPASLFEFFRKHNINFVTGNYPVGESFKESVGYNCLSTPDYFFHRKGFTEKKIKDANKDKIFINLPQAYTRCSLIYLCKNNFITSDKGIEKVLIKNNLRCFYFDPSDINIYDHKHGFIGGTAGVIDNKIFFNGNIGLHSDGYNLQDFINKCGFEIVSLGSHKLYDGGGIFFI